MEPQTTRTHQSKSKDAQALFRTTTIDQITIIDPCRRNGYVAHLHGDEQEPAGPEETTEDLDVKAKPSHPRSLARVAREEDARRHRGYTTCNASKQAKARYIPRPEKITRTKDDKAGPKSNTLHDWVCQASRQDLLALLKRNDHPTWFTTRLEIDALRDYIIDRRFSINTRRHIVPNGGKIEYERRNKIRMAKVREAWKQIEIGTY